MSVIQSSRVSACIEVNGRTVGFLEVIIGVCY